MYKLISSNFSRFVRMSIFKTIIAVMILISAVMLVSLKLNSLNADNDPFSVTVYMPMFIAVALGLFLSHDYTFGTVRNKLIIGYSRESIYFSNLVVCTIMHLIFFSIYLIIYWGVGIPLLGLSSDFAAKATVLSIAISLLLTVVNSSIVTFICMTVKSNTGTVLSVIINYAFMLFVVMGEVYSEKAAKFVYDFVPLGQAMQLNCREIPDHPMLMLLYSMIWIALSTFGGIAVFKKTDLK